MKIKALLLSLMMVSSTGFINPIGSEELKSNGFILRSGLYRFSVFTPQAGSWRWFGETKSLAPENVAPSDISGESAIKLRWVVEEVGGVSAAKSIFKLQFSERPDFVGGVSDVTEAEFCGPSSFWCYVDKIKPVNHKRNLAVEYEFLIKPASVSLNTVYFFRLFDTERNRPIALGDGGTFPSITLGSTLVAFSLDGSPSISFGSLDPFKSKEVSQRLTITSKGANGYRLFLFQRQGLLGRSSGAEIAPIAGTNEEPKNWASACADVSRGCYGYHSGDKSLSENSERFARKDTYARLEEKPKEIAFSPFPVAEDKINVIFKAEIGDEQPADTYESSVAYIIVPTF